MEHHLIVKHPFGDYRRGDLVRDPAEVAALLATAGEHVVRIHAPQSEEADAPVEGSPAG
jgi:hypothetical protein